MINKTEASIVGILIILILGFMGLVVGNSFTRTPPTPTITPSQTTPGPTASNDKGLQLQVIKLSTTPAVQSCLADNALSDATNCTCPNIDPKNSDPPYLPVQEPKCTLSSCVWFDYCNTQQCKSDPHYPNYCTVNYQGLSTRIGCDMSIYQKLLADGKPHCIGKPVIYLYPEKPTYISVSLQIPGQITQSIPQYEKNGWQHVLAQPNGELNYQGNNYHELFYESAVTTFIAPKNGSVIAIDQLKKKLDDYTTQLGLLPSERDEFLGYWLPKLYALHAPYILFSIFAPENKEAVDHVSISPAPDTRIEFLAYFKPLQAKINLEPLNLPITPPQRRGFTEVEWGGTLDNTPTVL